MEDDVKKVLYKEKIGNYNIIRFLAKAAVDSEKTKAKIEPMITEDMTEDDIEELYINNRVYAAVGAEAELIDDDAAIQIQEKLDAREGHQLLLDNGEYIADYRGAEYWIQISDKWQKEIIENIGLLPQGILSENLSKEQQEEITAQLNVERIASLSADEKANEKRNNLLYVFHESKNKAEEAEFLGEEFDKDSWLQQKKNETEALYA